MVLGRVCFLVFTTLAWCNLVTAPRPRHRTLRSTAPINLIFLGNPGVGKSSLLNQLHNKVAFAAGVKIGPGLTAQTAVVPSFTHHGRDVRLIDTPGLADSKMREKASEQITQGLQKGDDYKMVFVVNENSGRVVDEDRTTVRLILESIQGIDLRNNYAIIVNKVDEEVMPRMEAEFETFTSLLMDGFPYSTDQVLLLPGDSRLKNKDNVILPQGDTFTEKLMDFLDLVPPVLIPIDSVQSIAHDKFDDVNKMMADQKNRLLDMMESMMADMHSRLDRMEQKNQALQRQLMEARRETWALESAADAFERLDDEWESIDAFERLDDEWESIHAFERLDDERVFDAFERMDDDWESIDAFERMDDEWEPIAEQHRLWSYYM